VSDGVQRLRIHFFVKCITLFVLGLLLQGCVSTVMSGASLFYDRYSIQKSLNNQKIDSTADKAIETDPHLLKETNITVTSFNYIALITGQVHNEAERQKVGKIVATIPKVRKVVNALTLGKPVAASQQTEDAWITTKIRSKIIATDEINPKEVKVLTEDSTVYLMGVVNKKQARALTKISRQTSGVKRVVKLFEYLPV